MDLNYLYLRGKLKGRCLMELVGILHLESWVVHDIENPSFAHISSCMSKSGA